MKIRGFLAVLLLAVVVVYFLYMVKSGEQEHIKESVDAFSRTKLELTKANMATLQRVIVSFIADRGFAPNSLDELQPTPLGTGKFDGWGEEIRYKRLTDFNFRLISSGPDRTFATEDDIVREY